MDLNVSFRHHDTSAAVLARVERRARRVLEKVDPRARVRVVCDRDGPYAEVEVLGTALGRPLCAKARASDLYAAVDRAFAKVGMQLTREHDRRARRKKKRAPTAVVVAAA